VPPGWVAPGPPGSRREVALGPNEDLSWLLGDWRLIQRRDGHRWSLDDFITAFLAREAGRERSVRPVRDILDLGSGIGSVALMLAWCFPDARVTGVEAQALSFELAVRSAWANQVEQRVMFVHADLRAAFAPSGPLAGRTWDLVTGTPPYFDDPAQTRSRAVQKGPCRFEERGGVADYLAAMKVALAPDGRAVLCHASRQRPRVVAAIEASGLSAVRRLEVVPKVGREPLVDVFALAREGAAGAWERLVVRDADDQWTAEHLAVRLAMGMPPRP
jgi:tRNA1(Val) A37 N6-methylase TrmN6